ncbi:hypothetical protein IP86_02975 [Rhodopseudomonas sp. AAP120]|uniref:hypothetical protein n=1 Tax=Rhodopseudomonas sp. AAP120 TaxID=1523430 RepID=UPI0006B8E3DA|nr:hypothetical protein [Rhodopseudomonas sp. AAP120]KPG01787.1 hypothetical protein IP86_02975 [Rhodopseudomonas sp. AAP120]
MKASGLVERNTFVSGEISPELRERPDLAKHQTGLAACENFITLLEGGITRRPGTSFVIPHKAEDELCAFVPFRYSGADSYMLVFNGGVMRIVYNGGVVPSVADPYELEIPYLSDDLASLRYASYGNVIYLDCDGYPPMLLTRRAHLDWTISRYDPDGGPVADQNIDQSKTVQSSYVVGNVTLTANDARFRPEDVGLIWRLDESDLSMTPLWNANESVPINVIRRNAGNVYQALNAASAGINAPVHTEGDVSAGSDKVTWRYLHSGYGLVRITGYTSPTSVSATVLNYVPASVYNKPTFRWWRGAWNEIDGYPKIVRANNTRLLHIRNDELWLSQPQAFNSMQEMPGSDDSALHFAITSPDGASVEIVWAAFMGALVLGTRDGEWIVRGSNLTDPLTIDTVRPSPETAEGSAPHIPVITPEGVVFIGRSRRRLHLARLDKLGETLSLSELTKTARHILRGRARALAYQRDPHRVLWIGCEDGKLIAVTLLPSDEVVGWHRHPMRNGYVEALMSVPTSDEARSDVYLSVRRTINGRTRRYIERLADFFDPRDQDIPTAEGARFVDSAVAYSGVPAVSLLGLDHLEGQTVTVFADGAQQASRVVRAGGITLEREASDIVVGLPIVARARLLPQDLKTSAGSSRGQMKRSSHALVHVLNSAGGTVSCNDGEPEPIFETGSLDYGAPLSLFSGGKRVTMRAPIRPEATLELVCDNALPFTLLGLSPDLSVMED